MLHHEVELQQANVLFDFDVLIFQRPPEALHVCLIQTSSLSIHADPNVMGPQLRNIPELVN